MREIIRTANLNDIDFIIETIIQAEKSNTEICGFSKTFNLNPKDTKLYLKQILEEEIDGCEFSLENYYVYAIDEKPVAAVCGWVEGENSFEQPSSLLKSNLLSYILPKECIEYAKKWTSIINDIQIDRTPKTYQIEYVYCLPEYRGLGISSKLIKKHLSSTNTKIAEVQAFESNISAIRLYEKLGFSIKFKRESVNNITNKIFPCDTKVLLEKK